MKYEAQGPSNEKAFNSKNAPSMFNAVMQNIERRLYPRLEIS